MEAWFAWHHRKCFWQVGVIVEGERVVILEKKHAVPGEGEILLGLLGVMSPEEFVSWINRPSAGGPGTVSGGGSLTAGSGGKYQPPDLRPSV